MKPRILVTIVMASVTLGTSALLLGAGDPQAGKAVYDAKCKTCHGTDAKGNAALAKTLKVEFKDLASKEVQSKSDGDLKKSITGGTGKMQPVKGLSDKQVEDVIAFVRSLAKG